LNKEGLLSNIAQSIERFFNSKKQIAVLAIAIAVIVLMVLGISIYRISQMYIEGDLLTDVQNQHNRHIHLSVFKHSLYMLLLATILTVGIMLFLKVKLEYVFIVAALGLGMAYMMAITPLSVPDESYHYHGAYAVSGYMLFEQDPYIGDIRHFDFSSTVIRQNTILTYLRFMREGVFFIDRDPEQMNYQVEFNVVYPLWHAPQALGISIARLIGLSFFGGFYLGRFFNLLFYALCVSFSIKRLKAFKLPIFFIGLLPMCLHQAASFSYDAYVNGISMLFIAYAISCVYEKSTFSWRDYSMLLVLGILLAPAKVVYLPIIFLVFLVAWKWKKDIKAKAWVLASSIAIISVMAVIYTNYGYFNVIGGIEQEPNYFGGQNYRLSFIFENPIETIMIFFRSITYYYNFWFYGIFGLYLSGLTMYVPLWLINVTILMLIASVFCGKRDEWQPTISHRVIYFIVAVVVFGLCLASHFLGWTSDTFLMIAGVQGRYFLPILPLLLLLLKCSKIQIESKNYRFALIVGYIMVQSHVIEYIINWTIR